MGRALWICASLGLAACGSADGEANQLAPAKKAATSAVAATAAGAAAPVAAASGRVSRFTELGDKTCGKENVLEETGDWDRRCPGAGGYALEWSSGDLREELKLIRAGKTVRLGIPTKVAGGAFAALGKTVEWRGPAGGEPDVMVVRVHVANAEGKSDNGRLAIARLGASPCIVAVVPVGAGQSDRARAIADGKLPACLKD